jgi:hypothetical protein
VKVQRVVATIGVALFCAATVPSVATAAWSTPIAVSPPGENSVEPQVALNEHGDAVIVWKHWIDDHRDAVEFVSRSGGGSFTAPAVVSPEEGNFEPRVALDTSGNAVLMWVETTSTGQLIRVREGRAGGAFAAPVTVGSDTAYAGSHNSCIGADAAGQVTAFWTQSDSDVVHFAVRPSGGSFGPSQAIPNPGEAAEWPHCAVAANGDTFVSWTDGKRVLVATRRAGQTSFSTQVVRPFDSSRPMASIARLASNASGEAIVTWSEATDDSNTQIFNKAAWRPARGTFGNPETVGRTYGGGTGPVVDADGTATLLGVPGDLAQPPQDGPAAVTRSSDGDYGPSQLVTREGWDQDAAMSFDSAGNLFGAWRRYYDRSAPYGIAYAVVRPAGGTFPVPETPVSDAGRNVWDMVLDAGAAGHALAAWPRGWFPWGFHVEVSEFGGVPALSGSSGGDPGTPAGAPAGGDPGTPAGALSGGDPYGSQRPPAMHPAASPPLTPTGGARSHRAHRCRHRGARHHRTRRACRRHRRHR